jgi:hypothetical protein
MPRGFVVVACSAGGDGVQATMTAASTKLAADTRRTTLFSIARAQPGASVFVAQHRDQRGGIDDHWGNPRSLICVSERLLQPTLPIAMRWSATLGPCAWRTRSNRSRSAIVTAVVILSPVNFDKFLSYLVRFPFFMFRPTLSSNVFNVFRMSIYCSGG